MKKKTKSIIKKSCTRILRTLLLVNTYKYSIVFSSCSVIQYTRFKTVFFRLKSFGVLIDYYNYCKKVIHIKSRDTKPISVIFNKCFIR